MQQQRKLCLMGKGVAAETMPNYRRDARRLALRWSGDSQLLHLVLQTASFHTEFGSCARGTADHPIALL